MDSSSRFTAAEGGARLAAAAGESNILVTEYTAFIPMNLLIEHAYQIRGLLSDGKQRSIFITRPSATECVAHEFTILTSLKICKANKYSDISDWENEVELKEVLVCTSEVLKQILYEKILGIENINVLIIDSCHLIFQDLNLQCIMKYYKECKLERPRILALTYPLFTAPKVESEIDKENETINTDESNSTDSKYDDIDIKDTDKNTNEKDVKENINEDITTESLTVKDVKCNDLIETNDKIENITVTEDSVETVDNENSDLIDVNPKTGNSKDNNENIEVNDIGVYQNMDDFDMYEKLEWKIEELERELCCKMDLAEDIDGGKRITTAVAKPKEILLEYESQIPNEKRLETYLELETFMRNTISDAAKFIDEHRYDPTEIYGEDLYEEFINIPDPTADPKQLFKEFLYVLDQLGPYAADKAAFSLLIKLEKLKIKVPYERHFLLLCLCTSVFVKIRCYADFVFSKYESDWDKIILFSTPKVLRFAEILEQFKPLDGKTNLESNSNKLNRKEMDVSCKDNINDGNVIHKIENGDTNNINANSNNISSIKKSKTSEMLNVIDSCDFVTLGNKIEDRVNTYESNLKDLDDILPSKENIYDNCKTDDEISGNDVNMTVKINNKGICVNESKIKDESEHKSTEISIVNESKNESENRNNQRMGFGKRSNRTRGRGRAPRSNAAKLLQLQQNPDALCGIVFMRESLMAKIMFMMIVDMSRSRPALSDLCAQYCAAETSGTNLETRETQRQGRKQEDVLKKFRMYECNLLLATPALEEGIDLPRCNLVVRWDVPPSYRSHGLCRGRARAPRSAVALMVDGEVYSKELIHNLAIYKELDQIITRKCGCGIQFEPSQEEEIHADNVTQVVKPYTPLKTEKDKPIKDKENTESNTNTKDINVHKINNIIGNVNNKINAEILTTDNEIKNDCISVNSKTINANIEINNESLLDNIVVNCEIQQEDSNGIKNGSVIDNNGIINHCEIPVKTNDAEVSSIDIRDHKEMAYADVKLKNIKYDVNSKSKSEEISNSVASVDLSTAIALINKYCGKLPSDTFTRLAPQWWLEKVELPDRLGQMRPAYVCTLRMPLNCPVKYNIVGHPMPTRVLARRMVALQACRILHKSGELDNQLMPIGKENFKAVDLDNDAELNEGDCARPGTTKRRQYYFKRTAWAFTDCQPIVDFTDAEIEANPTPATEEIGKSRNMAWAIAARLWCGLPERYNTRGRRLHAPQLARQALGIMVARRDPQQLQIPSFPVYTRSGEVRVSVEPAAEADVRLSPRRAKLIRRFMRFVFSDVLRVRRRGMRLLADAAPHNNYYVVPTTKKVKEDGTTVVDIDWEFLELIFKHTEEQKNQEIEKPMIWEENEKKDKDKYKDKDEVKKIENPLLKSGEVFEFDAEKYKDAVVTPWYRNQDQPQFFLVAEICWNLSPESEFPSTQHGSFRSYYKAKYGAELTQLSQPLLDVDHTSARLNLLTPRYVNRKGVALPVSSERTRRNKRDRLDQKQILVPELCRRHPFAAPLWFATVALPCVLYRINALLIADEIRRAVAIDVGLGIPRIDDKTFPGFQWPPLDFGWSLAEVLNSDEKTDRKKDEDVTEDKQEMPSIEATPQQDGLDEQTEPKEKTLNEILQEETETGFEIGTWSNDMASSIPETEFDEFMEPLPANLTFCTSASGGANWAEPIEKPKSQFNPTKTYSVADSDYSYMSSDFDTDDSDLNSEASDDDTDTTGFYSGKNSYASMGVRIEYKTAHEAEAVDLERRKPIAPAPQPDKEDNERDMALFRNILKEGVPPKEYVDKFRNSVEEHEKQIIMNNLIAKDKPIVDLLPEVRRNEKLNENNKNKKIDKEKNPVKDIKDNINKSTGHNKRQMVDNEVCAIDDTKNDTDKNTENNKQKKLDTETCSVKGIKDEECSKQVDENNIYNNVAQTHKNDSKVDKKIIEEIFPYEGVDVYECMTLEDIEKNKRILLDSVKKSMTEEEIKKMACFSMVDINIDSPDYVNEKVANVGFDSKEKYKDIVSTWWDTNEYKPYYVDGKGQTGKEFDFDYQPDLKGHPGPSPSVILQALTMSNANDGINLERLETIGDSFLKFAITAYLYCAHPAVHEGKLSHMRSKQVSNLNLYRLGRNKRLGARMIASKFEPHDNWLPPCHKPPPTLQPNTGDQKESVSPEAPVDNTGCFIPYNLITQHSIPDKSIADCVEALIGAYLLECGPRGALLFMSWLGIRVLPQHLLPLPPDHPYVVRGAGGEESTSVQSTKTKSRKPREAVTSDSEWSSDDGGVGEEVDDEGNELQHDWSWAGRAVGALRPYRDDSGKWVQPIFGELKAPPSPLLRYIDNPEGELEQMLSGYDELERVLRYRFRDRALLLQALTHASHSPNRLTDCYQRLEFLGDAILDYLITRHLYEDPRRHSPGALTDLRSALVNNTIFATLAARHGFHKYFRHMSPGLHEVLTKYVRIQEENGHSISEEHYLIQEDEMEQAEDVEVPKALGDLFESVAGAIFLDSGMSLGCVWKSYVNLMGAELEAFSAAAPKSPVRELLEAEPDTAKFGKPERLADGRRVRVCVEVFGRGAFKGVGRNYRIAKGTAARCALRHLKRRPH